MEMDNASEETKAIMSMQMIVRGLWIRACKADGIDPQSQFVVFSEENRYAKIYNAIMLRILGAGAALN